MPNFQYAYKRFSSLRERMSLVSKMLPIFFKMGWFLCLGTFIALFINTLDQLFKIETIDFFSLLSSLITPFTVLLVLTIINKLIFVDLEPFVEKENKKMRSFSLWFKFIGICLLVPFSINLLYIKFFLIEEVTSEGKNIYTIVLFMYYCIIIFVSVMFASFTEVTIYKKSKNLKNLKNLLKQF